MQRRHPSALGSFEQIVAAAEGKQVVVFMDYDGTLSPIVADPDKAFMTGEVSETLREHSDHEIAFCARLLASCLKLLRCSLYVERSAYADEGGGARSGGALPGGDRHWPVR
jgi:hypothetical protein